MSHVGDQTAFLANSFQYLKFWCYSSQYINWNMYTSEKTKIYLSGSTISNSQIMYYFLTSFFERLCRKLIKTAIKKKNQRF